MEGQVISCSLRRTISWAPKNNIGYNLIGCLDGDGLKRGTHIIETREMCQINKSLEDLINILE